jgi:cytochrome c biogenesis protein CcmG, thiol:disulfide interchange protein DsbE
MRARMYWPIVVAAAALVGLLTYGVASKGTDTSIDQALLDGETVEAPDVELPLLGRGGSASLADYRGKVVVMNFWASWCPPCVSELPLLERTQRSLQSRGATVLGVNIQDATEDALGYVRRFDLTFPSLRDVDRKFARRFGTSSYPETFVVDREGRITALKRGPVDEAWLDENVEPLL